MLKSGRNNTIDLVNGPIFSSLIRFSIPILFGSIVTQFYNVADSMIVGRFISSEALAAVSASAPIVSIINLFAIGLSSGSNVVIAQRVGSGNHDALQRAVSTISFLTLSCSAFITVLGLIISRPMLAVLKTPEEIMDASTLYLIIVFLGTTGNLIYQMGTGALRGMGDVNWPLFFLVICSALNIIFDLIAVLVFDLGVEGVAAATAISQIISGVGIIYRLNRGDYGVTVGLSELKPDSYELGEIVRIGLPAAIQNIGNTLASMFVQSSVNSFGSTFIAANSIVNRVDMLLYIPVDAVSTALCTFVGQNMGRLQLDRIRKGINSSIASLTVLGAGLCGLQIALRNVLPLLFTKDSAVLDITSDGLFIMAFQCLFYGIDRCLVNAMRGAGKSVVPMITAQFGAFSRVPLSYYLGVKTGDWHGIFWAMLIAAFLRNAAISLYYFGGGWNRVVRQYEEKHPELISSKYDTSDLKI